MKFLLKILLLVIVLFGVGIWAAPNLVDINAFRKDIEESISKSTGQIIKINGDITFRVLPSPAFYVQQVRVMGGKTSSSEPILEIDELRLNADFWPLLNKQIKLTDVQLVGPVLNLQQLKRFLPYRQSAFPAAMKTSSYSIVDAVSFDTVKITNGTILLMDNGMAISRINLDLMAPSLFGPYTANGMFQIGELPLVIDLTSGRVGEGQTLPLDITILSEDTLNSASYNGVFHLSEIGAEGGMTLTLGTPYEVLKKLAPKYPVPTFLARMNKAVVKAELHHNQRHTNFENVELNFEDASLKGEITFTPKPSASKIQVNLFSDFVNLNTFLGQRTSWKHGIFKTLGHMDVPTLPITADFNLNIKQLVQGDLSFDNLLLDGHYDQGKLSITEFSAKLPGQSSLVLSGKIIPEHEKSTAVWNDYDLGFEIASALPKKLLSELGLEINPVIPDMGPLFIKGRAQGINNGIRLIDTLFKLGQNETLFTGSYIDTDIPHVEADISCSRFDWPLNQESDDKGILDQFPLNLLLNLNIEFALSCQKINHGKMVFEDVKAHGRVENNQFFLSEPTGFRFGGLEISLAGKIGQTFPLDDLDLIVKAQGKHVKKELEALGFSSIADYPALEEFSVSANITGNVENAAYSLKGHLTDFDLQLGGTVEGLNAANPIYEGKLRIRHNSAKAALKYLLDNADVPETMSGHLDFYTAFKAKKENIYANDITATLGDLVVKGDITADISKTPTRIKATIQTTKLDLDQLLVVDENKRRTATGKWSARPFKNVLPGKVDIDLHLNLDGIKYKKFDFKNVAANISANPLELNLNKLDLSGIGGSIGVSGQIKQSKNGNLNARLVLMMSSIQSKLLLETLGLGPSIDGVADVTADLETKGSTEQELISKLTGDVTFMSEGGVINGVDLESVSDNLEGLLASNGNGLPKLKVLMSALEGGQTRYDTAQCSIGFKNGIGTINAGEITTKSGNIQTSGLVDLPKWKLNTKTTIRLSRPQNVPEFGITLRGAIHSPEKRLLTDSIDQYLKDRIAQTFEQKLINKLDKHQGEDFSPVNDNNGPVLPVDPKDAFKELLNKLGK